MSVALNMNKMDDQNAEYEIVPVSSLALIYDMIRQQKHTSAAAAKKAAAALRAQLHQELENKKMCSYQPHECTQLTLDGYDYCLRHIMEDKTAPYRQCSFVYNSNGRRCHLPAPKGEKREHVYCTDHAFKCHLTRVRAASKHYPTNSVESLLDSLSHHVTTNSVKNTPLKPEDLDDKTIEPDYLKTTKHLDPFTEVDASAALAARNRILDFGSESDSDVEPANYTSVWHDAQAESSDDESIDSENEDVLKHAGIYTAEEVTLVTRDKLIRLQSLYIEQFKHLQHVLKERRRKFLFSLKREKDNLASIHSQPKETAKEKRIYNKLKALNHYHKKHGIDAIMNKKFIELRAKLTDGSSVKPSSFTKCSYVEGGVKCGEKVLPVAKHCRKHILSDRNQVLFKRCSHVQDDFECNESVLGIFKDAMCKFHADLPPIRHYGETRTFDDSDMEDSSDTHDQHAIEFMASSSCDSRAPATITSNDLMNFSNQFPSSSKDDIYDDPSLRDINLSMEDIDNTLDANSGDYLHDVSNEMDAIDEKMGNIEDLDVPENFNESLQMLTEHIDAEDDLIRKMDDIDEKEVQDEIKINEPEILKQETIEPDASKLETTEADIMKLETTEADSIKLETNEADTIKLETNKADILKMETNDVDTLKIEIKDVDTSKLEPESEIPKLETYEADIPKIETLEPEISKIETLESDLSKMETLEPDKPKNETPESDVSKIETLESDISKIETPESDISKIETPEPDMSKMETPELDMSKMETPEPDMSKMETLEPVISKIETPEQDLSKMETIEPDMSKIETLKSDASNMETDIFETEINEPQTLNIETNNELSQTIDKINEESIKNDPKVDEIPEIDPDDDMAGIMMEMQKDNFKNT